MTQELTEDLAEMPVAEDLVPEEDEAPEAVPVPHLLAPHLNEIAILLDIDGTLLDLMPTPREVLGAAGALRNLEPPPRADLRRAGAGQRPFAQ